MRSIAFAALTAGAVLIVPSTVLAQSLGQLQWVSTGSSFAGTFTRFNGTTLEDFAGGAYLGNAVLPGAAPWYLQADAGFGPAVNMYSMDLLHTAWTTTYPAYFTNLAFDELVRTRSNNLTRYQQAAWLVGQMELQSFSGTDRQDRIDLHAAIYRLLAGDPRSGTFAGSLSGASEARVTNWIDLAQGNYQSVDLQNFTVITSACVYDNGQAGSGHASTANPQCGREYMVHAPLSDGSAEVVPEPATILMLATGLLAIVGTVVRGRLA